MIMWKTLKNMFRSDILIMQEEEEEYQKKKEKDYLNDLEPTPAKIVKCNECKFLLYEENAQKIIFRTVGRNYTKTDDPKYYCPSHHRKYDRVEFGLQMRYFKEIEVDKDGKSI